MLFVYAIGPADPLLFLKQYYQLLSDYAGRAVLNFLNLKFTGTLKSGWQRQTKDFGHGQNTNRDQSNKYSSLIFDNRGIGESDKPLARYSTSEMAKDTLELIDNIGWTAHRQLHVIGVSMGGMIAQELVRLLWPPKSGHIH